MKCIFYLIYFGTNLLFVQFNTLFVFLFSFSLYFHCIAQTDVRSSNFFWGGQATFEEEYKQTRKAKNKKSVRKKKKRVSVFLRLKTLRSEF